MRVSIEENDPGYATYLALCNARGGGIHVSLDGVRREHVLTADEEEGFLLRFKDGENGEVLIDPETDELPTETLHGVVRVELEPVEK